MTGTENHEHLIKVLKFTPTKVKLTVSGYGGEVVLGTISHEAYQHWVQRSDEELSDFVLDNESDSVPDYAKFVEPGAWYDCDDIAHHSGAEMSNSTTITVENVETGETVWRCDSMDPGDLEEQGVGLDPGQEYYAHFQPSDRFCYFGQSIEKGTFFGGEFVLNEPFDAGQLVLQYDDVEGFQVLTGIIYQGQDVDDCDGADTWGKGMQFAVLSGSQPQEHRD